MNFRVELEGKTVLFIIMVIILTRLTIANFPILEPYLEQCAYVHVTKDMKKIRVEDMERVLDKRSGTELYYIGRSSCGDCREVIKNILVLENSLSGENITMKYVELENEITDVERKQLDIIGVKEIPVILLVNDEETRCYDYYDMISNDYRKRFTMFIGGEKNDC